jgi:urease accessory protein
VRDNAQLARAPEPLEHLLERASGAAEVSFGSRGGETVVRHLYQRTPCRVLFPRIDERDLPTGVLLTTCGGLTGGDRLTLSFEVLPGARAVFTTQAAEKIYRALALDAAIDVSLAVGEHGWLEWVPQETILFDGARLVRRTEADVAPGGRLLAGEIVVFGRTAHGERFTRGRLFDDWRVRRGGRLVWADALRLAGDVTATLAHPAGFDSAVAIATLVYVADDAASWLETARGLLDDDACRGGATVVNGVLIARLLGRDARRLRNSFAHIFAGLRSTIMGLPAAMPRVWGL